MQKKYTITILNFDMSDNSLGRAYIIANALKRFYNVEIIGLSSSGKIWQPLIDENTINFKIFNMTNLNKYIANEAGDVIYAIKPKGTSFGLGLFAKFKTHRPLILDIDDWEVGFYNDWKLLGKLYSFAQFWNLNNITYTYLLEKMVKHVDALTVSNLFLQNRFGGVVVPHFRDTDEFNPLNFDSTKLKKGLGLNNKKVILFLGTPRRHKGIFELIDSLDSINRNDTKLLIVGASESDENKLPKREYITVVNKIPFSKIPNYLSIANLVVLLQKNTSSSLGQLPAKVFDAMSMAKPIIASNVSDLPIVLKDCGIVVDPNNTDQLSKSINYILDNPDYANKLGQKARQKCIDEYSYDALAPTLRNIVEGVISKARDTANK